MVKFTADGGDGRTRIGLGICEGNVERLRNRQPIHIRLDDPDGMNLGFPLEIMIFYEPTEQALVDSVRPHMRPSTIVHDTRASHEHDGALEWFDQ